ncbi:MAG: ATP-dependent 6-phosphofructokinase, partial [Ignavibacteriales bacterium]
MENMNLDFSIAQLGKNNILSSLTRFDFTPEDERILYHDDIAEIKTFLEAGIDPPGFEAAGPREKIFFNSTNLKCGIVTCGGLCPGINDVIRAIVMSLYYHYNIKDVVGFQYGYEGIRFVEKYPPIQLTPQYVSHIHDMGGTILGSSRGNQETSLMVDALVSLNIGILFTIGGDGTLRGAHAIAEEVNNRGLNISVIGIPKTIDNDISFIQTTFGFDTAVSEARRATHTAHIEAIGVRNGIGLVKLMGRDSGFIAAYTTLADKDVNYCLVPENPFDLNKFLSILKKRIENRGHAVIVVAEGAGQHLLDDNKVKDASGNVRYGDIGLFLKDEINDYFKMNNTEISLKYIDPSYMIRSLSANARDSALCLMFAHSA